MAIELFKLIQKVKHMDLELVAGKEGMHNYVDWAHIAETNEAIDFLSGDELVFTTGLGLSRSFTLLDYIKKIHEKHGAGVVVNIGPHIEKIDKKSIDYCNEVNLPLFVVPWRIHLSEIMRIFCFCISKSEQKDFETAAAFKIAIFFPSEEALYIVPLSQRGFSDSWSYSACTMSIAGSQDADAITTELIAERLRQYIKYKYDKCCIFTYNDEIIMVLADYDVHTIRSITSDVRKKVLTYLSENETLNIGVGRLTKSIRCLYKSYNQAVAIRNLHKSGDIDRNLFFYTDMGIYRLLLGVEDKELINDYLTNTIGKIIKYDAENKTNLCETLDCYLRNNGSVNETSKEMFVHRNTINYKLNKLEEILDADLSSLELRMQLMMALKLRVMIM